MMTIVVKIVIADSTVKSESANPFVQCWINELLDNNTRANTCRIANSCLFFRCSRDNNFESVLADEEWRPKVKYGVDLQSLFGLHSCTHWLRPPQLPPPPPAFGLIYEVAIGQPKWTTSLCNSLVATKAVFIEENRGLRKIYSFSTVLLAKSSQTDIMRCKKGLGGPPANWATVFIQTVSRRHHIYSWLGGESGSQSPVIHPLWVNSLNYTPLSSTFLMPFKGKVSQLFRPKIIGRMSIKGIVSEK
jgi:hypothetical protein